MLDASRQEANQNARQKIMEASEILVSGGTVHNYALNYFRDGCERFSYPLFELLGYVYQIRWPDYHFMFIQVDSAVIADGKCTEVVHSKDSSYANQRFQQKIDDLIAIVRNCPDREAAFQKWERRKCPVFFEFDQDALQKKEG